MAEGLLSYGVNRRAMLGEIDQSLMQYIPPHLRSLTGLLADANPVVSMERAGTASQGLLSDNATPMQRVGYAGDMLSNMAGVAAPAMVAGRAGVPAANAIQEGLLGMSQAARLPEFMADESGALRLYQGSPHDYAAERLVRMPDGSTQYIVGRPDVMPDVPTGAEVLRDFPLGRARMDKIGTGEGNQNQGWGLYFAKRKKDAKYYADTYGGKTGKMYEVNIGSRPQEFLDWGVNVGDMPRDMKEKIRALAGEFVPPDTPGKKAYAIIKERLGTDEAASKALLDAGIPGVKYGSHGMGENYVVFDENLINIVRKYGIAGAAAMLGMSQADVAQAAEQQNRMTGLLGPVAPPRAD